MSLLVENFFAKLARGQLKNVALADDTSVGMIRPDKVAAIVELTNQGLQDIFTRKKLKEGRNILTLTSGVNDVFLDPTGDYADMVKVLEFVTGDERSHTARSNKHIFQSDQYNFQFSDTFTQYYLDRDWPNVEVRYQMLHPVVDANGTIEMPAHLHEALVLYVSGLYLSHMGGEEHSKKGDTYYGLYLQMMMDDTLENRSGTSEVLDDDTRFNDRGFV